jgi:hypothetical protein
VAQPVKLSDELVLDARLTGEASERSIAGQVEFWARLGRAVEALMRTEQVLALKRVGDAKPLSAALESVQTSEGREQLAQVLSARPYPHFEAAPDRPGVLVKIDKDGTRTLGRFVQRVFTALEQP